MLRNILTAASAGTALVIAAPLFAQAHGNAHAGGSAIQTQGSISGSNMGIMNSPMRAPVTSGTTQFSTNSQALTRSQGPSHASPNGISHASPNSVLARGSVSAATLAGLRTGLSVTSSTGTSIGTVSQVITGTDGSIRQVIVTSPSGQTFRLAPSTLSISGNVVTTTSTLVGG
jgi:hypothetical protein